MEDKIFLLSCIVFAVLHDQACGLTCEQSWRFYDDQCFKHFQLQVNHTEAEVQCQFAGGQLAFNLTNTQIAILSDEQDETSSFWYNRDENSLPPMIKIPIPNRRKRRLIRHEHSFLWGDEDCFYIQNKTEQTGPCAERRGFICEKNATLHSVACLQDIANSSDWYTARKICQANGSDLYSYGNETAEAIALEYADNPIGMWIGLIRELNSTDFRWSDGSYLNYTNWSPGQPEMNDDTKLCVAHTGENLKWEVQDCNCSRPFNCKPSEMEEPTVMATHLPVEQTTMTAELSEMTQSTEMSETTMSQSTAKSTAVSSESSVDPTTMLKTSHGVGNEQKSVDGEVEEKKGIINCTSRKHSTEKTRCERIGSVCTLSFEYIYVAAAILGTTVVIVLIFATAVKFTRSRPKEDTSDQIPAELLEFLMYTDGVPNGDAHDTTVY